MDNRLIFLCYHISDGVTEEANLSQLVDFGLSTKRELEENPQFKTLKCDDVSLVKPHFQEKLLA